MVEQADLPTPHRRRPTRKKKTITRVTVQIGNKGGGISNQVQGRWTVVDPNELYLAACSFFLRGIKGALAALSHAINCEKPEM